MFGGEPQFRTAKRARSPDGDEVPQHFQRGYAFNRGPPPIGGPSFHKRPRGDSFQPTTIEEKIARLGVCYENNEINNLKREIDDHLREKLNDAEAVKNIASQVCKCIISFPTHVTSYATLVGYVGIKHYDIACQVVDSLIASYPIYFVAQKWQEALTIVYTLASLVNCSIIKPTAIIEQFKLFLDAALQGGAPQVRNDYLVYSIMSSLPYVAHELAIHSDETKASLEQLLTSVEAYLEKRSKGHLNATRIWISSDSTVQMDYLESLWVQIKNFRANSWNDTFLHRPYLDRDYKESMTSSLVPRDSLISNIPPYSSDHVYPCPRIVFRLYDDDIIENNRTMPGPDKIERFCIENHIRYTIDEIPKDKVDCARQLVRMFRCDSLPMRHLLIEVLLGELLTLPKPKHDPLIYHALIAEVAKLYSRNQGNPNDMKNTFEYILNQGIKVLFENMETMNITCIERIVEWFSFYLNNAKFVFPWQMWSEVVGKSRTSTKSIFVQELISRIIRFSFHKKVSALVGEHLADFLPPEPEITYAPVFKDNPKADELSTDIRKLIVHKASDVDICQALNIMVDGVKMPDDFVLSDDKYADKLLKIDIFTAVILSIAAKSLTHLSSAIGKFRNMIRSLTSVDGGQVQLLQTLNSCMSTHTQAQVILVDKLIKADLVKAKEVCNWIFSEPMKVQHLQSHPWEMLNNTLNRVALSISDLQRDLKKKVDETSKADADGDIEMEQKDVSTNGEAQDAEEKKEKPKVQELGVAELEAKLEKTTGEFYSTVLLIFEQFSQILSGHISECERKNVSYMDDWFRWVTGQMQRIYFNHYDALLKRHDEIKGIVDRTPSIGCLIVNLNV